MLTNPPYGEKIKEEIMQLYRAMGGVLRHSYPGFETCILTAELQALNEMGLKPVKEMLIVNGAVECHFNSYLLNGEGESVETTRVDSEL
jgi:23S rRNA G2445 N2-methylase RlmL